MPRLDDLLERYSVCEAEEVIAEDQHSTPAVEYLGGWYALMDDDGVIAYFAHEADALRFRLVELNRKLNG